MSLPKFSPTARFLHWLSAAIILWATVSGLFIALADVSEQVKHAIGVFNVSVTTLFIPFFLWRLIYRFRHPVPEYIKLSLQQSRKAKIAHWAMYMLVFVVLLSGVLMMDAPFVLLGLVELPQLVTSAFWLQFFIDAHTFSTRLLAVLVVLHLFAVVVHEWRGMQVFRRMG